METTIKEQIRAIMMSRRDLQIELNRKAGYTDEDIAAMETQMRGLTDAVEVLRKVESLAEFFSMIVK